MCCGKRGGSPERNRVDDMRYAPSSAAGNEVVASQCSAQIGGNSGAENASAFYTSEGHARQTASVTHAILGM